MSEHDTRASYFCVRSWTHGFAVADKRLVDGGGCIGMLAAGEVGDQIKGGGEDGDGPDGLHGATILPQAGSTAGKESIEEAQGFVG